MHVDLFGVNENTTVTLEVTVHYQGEEHCPGLKLGGVLNIVRQSVEVVCPAGQIPEEFVADISALEIGDTVKISDIKLPANVEPTITDRDFTIATIAAPTKAVEVDEAETSEEGEGDAAAEAGDAEEGGDD